MIIEKVNIKSFGMLTDTTLEFSETVNVIEGENESGKSTIAAFIRYMLYGFDGAESTERMSERRRRINWDSGKAEGSMTVRVRGKRYLINRVTTLVSDTPRPTYKEESSIIDLESGTPAFGKSPAGEVFFGVKSDLFNNTAFIGSLAEARIDQDAVKESIENILFSGSEKLSTQRASAKIGDKMEILLHKSGLGGAIYDLMQKEEALEEELRRAGEENKRILEKEAELHTIRERRREAEEKQKGLCELDSCYKNVMIIQTFDKLHDLECESEEKNEVYSKFLEENTKSGFLPDEGYRAELLSARRSLSDTYRTLNEASETYAARRAAVGITKEIEGAIERSDTMGGEEAIKKNASSHRFGIVRDISLAVLSALIAIASLVIEIVATGALATIFPRIGFALLLVLSLVACGYFVYSYLKNTKALSELAGKFATESFEELTGKLTLIGEARMKRDTTIREIEDAKIAEEAARQNYENAKRHLTGIVMRWSDAPPQSGQTDFLDGLEERVNAFLEKKNELLHDKDLAEITVKEIRRSLAGQSEIDIRAQVPPLKRKALTEIRHDEILSGIEECKLRIEEQQALAFDVENELSMLKARAKDPGEIYAKMRLLEEQIAELRLRHKAYYIAHKTIGAASDALREEISPRLGEFATGMMSVMTDQKYASFDVTNGLTVTYTAEDGTKKSADFLSGGTQDLTYIAVRMALIDMLYTEKPPVTFDESFAHQDNVRARAMMRAIVKLGEGGYQSFIFTCRAREAALVSELDRSGAIYRLSTAEEPAALGE